MTTLTDEQMERAARELCRLRGIAPDVYRDWNQNWYMVALEIKAHLEIQQAIATAMKEQA